jgi:hypothetical protein
MKNNIEHKHWLSAVLEYSIPQFLDGKLIGSILIFGFIPWTYTATLFLLRAEALSTWVKIGYAGVSTWVSIAPYLIWRWERKTMTDFFEELSTIIINRNDLTNIKNWFYKAHPRWSLIFSLIWAAISVAVWTLATQFSPTIGLKGLADPMYIIGLVISGWGGFLAGMGFSGVFIMVWLIYKIAKLPFTLEPLHHDNCGGMACFGKCAVSTTLLFGTGILFLPFLFTVIAPLKEMPFLVWFLIISWALFVIISFSIPILIVSSAAKKTKNAAMVSVTHTCKKLTETMQQGSKNQEMLSTKYLELLHLHLELYEYKHLSVYPVNIEILTSLFFQAFSPLLVFLFKHIFAFQ